jgi:hypothetical protein
MPSILRSESIEAQEELAPMAKEEGKGRENAHDLALSRLNEAKKRRRQRRFTAPSPPNQPNFRSRRDVDGNPMQDRRESRGVGDREVLEGKSADGRGPVRGRALVRNDLRRFLRSVEEFDDALDGVEVDFELRDEARCPVDRLNETLTGRDREGCQSRGNVRNKGEKGGEADGEGSEEVEAEKEEPVGDGLRGRYVSVLGGKWEMERKERARRKKRERERERKKRTEE